MDEGVGQVDISISEFYVLLLMRQHNNWKIGNRKPVVTAFV